MQSQKLCIHILSPKYCHHGIDKTLSSWTLSRNQMKYAIACHSFADGCSQSWGCKWELIDDSFETNRGDIPELLLVTNHVVAKVINNGFNLEILHLSNQWTQAPEIKKSSIRKHIFLTHPEKSSDT